MPSKCMLLIPLYAFSTASCNVVAFDVAAMTRPPDVLSFPSTKLVPAWKIVVSVRVSCFARILGGSRPYLNLLGRVTSQILLYTVLGSRQQLPLPSLRTVDLP